MTSTTCATCAYEAQNEMKIDNSKSNQEWADLIDVSEASIRRHRKHAGLGRSEHGKINEAGEFERTDADGTFHASRFSDEAWGYDDYLEFIESRGMDPDEVTFTWGWTSNPHGGFWNKLNNVRKKDAKSGGGPEWPVVQPAAPVEIKGIFPSIAPARNGLTMSLKGADNQIGFRALPNGTYEAFHDDKAMNLFVEVARIEQPESIVILGDFLDLAAQGRWTQEAGFANTTQMAIDHAHAWLAKLRKAAPFAEIIIVEGNHDKRMQGFIETNALAAFGLTRANMPESWPVMSLPYLLRLDDLNVKYVDAYPAATHWDDDRTRNIHGTRANSKGSTMAQYANDLPHINTWAGHTHRAEIVYKTVMGARGEAIESYSANPGALCRTDGVVPGVHSALHADGSSALIVEDWHQGFGVNLFSPVTGESWPQIYRIRDGKALYNGEMIEVI
ncbi:metallophosphatase [Microbacterium phage Musetta]|nr:metallophosphatase [Microbacterium phage Musetta]